MAIGVAYTQFCSLALRTLGTALLETGIHQSAHQQANFAPRGKRGRELGERQGLHRQLSYEQHRSELLVQAESQRKQALAEAANPNFLQNWPVRLSPAQFLNHPLTNGTSPTSSIPLIILLILPEAQNLEGHSFDLQGHVRGPLQQFLATQYSLQGGSARPLELLDLILTDHNQRGGLALKAIYERLAPVPLLIIEVELLEATFSFHCAWWGPLHDGYQALSIGELGWHAGLQASAKARALQWRTAREELIRDGHAKDQAEADRLFGGENAENLKIFELEEQLGGQTKVRLPAYQLSSDDFIELYRYLNAWYYLATALAADVHHFRYNDALPRLPSLLSNILQGTNLQAAALTEVLLDIYGTLAVERPQRTQELLQTLTALPELPTNHALHERLASLLATQAQAEVAATQRIQKLAPQDLHGQSKTFVQQRQRETAEILGTNVIFRHSLKDGGHAPEMTIIPAGRFLIGSPASEAERFSDEGPQHQVTIARPFAIGRYAITFEEFDAFCVATRRNLPDDMNWGRGRRPVINVSWIEAVAYCTWLSAQTGHIYRLPSEAEWEYAARAGTTTSFWWGNRIDPSLANYFKNQLHCGSSAEDCRGTLPVDSFQANPFGLYQVHGNVWEWCQDIWHENYIGAPEDSSAWETDGEPSLRVLRGGSWYVDPWSCRAADRFHLAADFRFDLFGFRVCCGDVGDS